MTTSRLAVLLALLLGGLSTVFILPKQLGFQPVGIKLELPKMVGGAWYGRDAAISDRERGGLGPGTEFARKNYTNGRGDEIQASIVLAGQDMNTSIHRPEWCLPAQGWTIAESSKASIALPDRGVLRATRLHNVRFLLEPETGKPVLDKDGRSVVINHLDYYWFVGSSDATDTHLSRNLLDIRDRVLKGYNQRWAFITVAAVVGDNLRKDGLNERQTDEAIREFIRKLAPMVQKDTVRFD